MANIKAATEEKIVSIQKWLGLNQAGDGDTHLKTGEASEMVNFRVTNDGALKKRPGMQAVYDFGMPINGAWHGYVGGVAYTVVSAGGKLYTVDVAEREEPAEIGTVRDAHTEFFGFAEKLYILDGEDYRVWPGAGRTAQAVEGYVPVVLTNTAPSGGGTELQAVNRLTAKRRVWFSPDGTSTAFVLPEQGVQAVESVKNRVTGAAVSGYTVDTAGGKVVFSTPPAKGENTIEVTYAVQESDRAAVTAMRFAEIYNGTTDNRVFLYGDGSNRALYSGLDYDGSPTAEYFPDLNVLEIGDANTPITQLIRHYSRMIAYKTDSAYSVQYGQITLADGRVTAAFYWSPINRAVGNSAPGQVRLVDNNPLTLFHSSVYRWVNSSSYSSNLTVDERQAKRVSDRVWKTLEGLDLAQAYCYDDNERKEWYCVVGTTAVVYNYGLDVWYLYKNFPVRHMIGIGGRLYGARGNVLVEIADEFRSDCGEAIAARWASGNMAFNADFRRKYSAMLWVGIVPTYGGELEVTIMTDRKADFSRKIVARNRATFAHADFANWSFETSRRPTMQRLKLKAKKFTYYKLIFTNDSDNTTAAVTSTDVRVRYTGYVR